MDHAKLVSYIDAQRARRTASWGYHSRVSVAHRYIAMTVPKVACTTVKLALHQFEGRPIPTDRPLAVHEDYAGLTLLDHPTDVVVEMLRSADWLRFGFARNPYSRLVSAWKSKLASEDEAYEPLRRAICAAFEYPHIDGTRANTISFRDSVDYLLSDEGGPQFDDHWVPQSDVLQADMIDYDVLVCFETFQRDFTAVLRRLGAPSEVVDTGTRVSNATTPVPLATVYDSGLAKRIFDRYEVDFVNFGYSASSWRSE